jgi:hypothetical protein
VPGLATELDQSSAEVRASCMICSIRSRVTT